MIVTRPNQGVEQVAALDTASSKGSDKPEVLKTRGNSGQFYPVLPEKVCAQKVMYFKIHAYFYR